VWHHCEHRSFNNLAANRAQPHCKAIGTTFAFTGQRTSAVNLVTRYEPYAMEMHTLRDLYIKELKDLYSAENQLVKALPKMAKAATAKSLKNGFEKHLKETETHVDRLKGIFSNLGVSPGMKKCKAMQGLIEEGEEVIKEDSEPEVKDAALIAAAQRVEHYEIAGYGCVQTYASLLGDKQAAKTLQKTLDEEGATDKKLTQLAGRINVKAEDPPKRPRKPKSLGKRVLEAVGME
jgi:ferritin-like metal-binding protein YciE